MKARKDDGTVLHGASAFTYTMAKLGGGPVRLGGQGMQGGATFLEQIGEMQGYQKALEDVKNKPETMSVFFK